MQGDGILMASAESWHLARLGLFCDVNLSVIILFLDTLILDYYILHHY